jgi:glycogen operon protein
VPDFATRFLGSSDLYEWSARKPHASINFVTCHDGFTLNDLVSYDHKHNEANGENNRDGADDNISWNCGVEGPTDDPQIKQLREKKKRNFLATLILSQGVPMLLAGDEISHTQNGNNNTYCQDNELTWINWELSAEEEELLLFTRRITALWQEQPVFRRRRFFHGRKGKLPEALWLAPDGNVMTEEAWGAGWVRCVGLQMLGGPIDVDEQGGDVVGDTFLILFNADHGNEIEFKLPAPPVGGPWEMAFDTARPDIPPPARPIKSYLLAMCSMAVFIARVEREEATV